MTSNPRAHSLHAVLVGFPLAFYSGTLVTLLGYLATGESYWYRTAFLASAAGVGCAVVAALPGLITLLRFPPDSAARELGVEHAFGQMFATGLFAIGSVLLGIEWSTRSMIEGRYLLDALLPLVFTGIGFLTMIVGGVLGRTVAQTEHVPVPSDPVVVMTDSGETDGVDFLDDVPTAPISVDHGDETDDVRYD